MGVTTAAPGSCPLFCSDRADPWAAKCTWDKCGDCLRCKQQWIVVQNAMCDTRAGEKYMGDSPGKLPTVRYCQRACEDNLKCQSITYFRTGWCSFYRTPCTATTWTAQAVA